MPRSDIRELARWPDAPPDVPPFMHGWFFGELVLQPFCGPHVELVVELGSWLGKSARWFCRNCPNALIVCIDHWQGTPEILSHWGPLVPRSYETFLRNLWDYRDRVVPLRMPTTEGIALLEEHGVHPDLVYIDAGHDDESVREDVTACVEAFPDAVLVGDDWNMDSVKRGVRASTTKPIQNTWRLWWTE